MDSDSGVTGTACWPAVGGDGGVASRPPGDGGVAGSGSVPAGWDAGVRHDESFGSAGSDSVRSVSVRSVEGGSVEPPGVRAGRPRGVSSGDVPPDGRVRFGRGPPDGRVESDHVPTNGCVWSGCVPSDDSVRSGHVPSDGCARSGHVPSDGRVRSGHLAPDGRVRSGHGSSDGAGAVGVWAHDGDVDGAGTVGVWACGADAVGVGFGGGEGLGGSRHTGSVESGLPGASSSRWVREGSSPSGVEGVGLLISACSLVVWVEVPESVAATGRMTLRMACGGLSEPV